ncbi:MAG: YihY/virulence factor BrkB family protein [Ferruginibacter sp.]
MATLLYPFKTMSLKFSLKGLREVLKNAFKGFIDDKVPKLSGSLAYATIFSLAPLLMIIISLGSIFLGREAVEGKIYTELNGFIGASTAAQIQEIIKNGSLAGKTKLAAIIGLITLLIGATSVFAEIQDSINSIWGLKPKPRRGWVRLIKNRFLSFSVIISLGFLLLVSLGVTYLIDGFSDRLIQHFPEVTIIIFYIVNLVISFAVISLLFAVIFKVLPDAEIKWKDVLAGAMATAVLFMLGKFVISFYITKSNVGSTYGTAGSIIILLLWVYYSAIILYFGAEFTKAWAIKFGSAIYPNHYAVTVKVVEVEMADKPIDTNAKEVVNEKHK